MKITNVETRGAGFYEQRMTCNQYQDGEVTMTISNESQRFSKAKAITTITTIHLDYDQRQQLIEYLQECQKNGSDNSL